MRLPVSRSDRRAPLCCLLLLGACAAAPTAKTLATADYGPRPDSDAPGRIRAAFAPLLIDAGAASFRFKEPEQGWGRDDKGFVYGWVIWTEVNSKNQFGAFTGWKSYKVLLAKGEVHSIYEPKGDDLFGNPQFQRVSGPAAAPPAGR